MSKLIGLLGSAGVGKDTAADYLVKKYGYTKISLADEMKRICKRVYDFSDEQLWGPSANRNKQDPRYPRRTVTTDVREPNGGWSVSRTTEYLSPRVALQILGTEFGRACYENTWIDATIRDAQMLMTGDYSYSQTNGLKYSPDLFDDRKASVVIPDVRFKNEVEAIQKAGGSVVRLRRATKTDALTVGVQGHVSEAEQLSIPDSKFDYVLEVPDGLDRYFVSLDNMVSEGLL